jgi:hypothetical protein
MKLPQKEILGKFSQKRSLKNYINIKIFHGNNK